MLKELQDVSNLFTIDKYANSFGRLIKITAKEKLVHADNISLFNNNFLYSLRVNINELHNVVYMEMDPLGKIVRVIKETEGILPKVFIAPNNTIWCCILDAIDERELVIPLLNRHVLGKVQKYRSFVGDWIGNSNNTVLFYNRNLFGDKPDQLLKLEFMGDSIIKREIVKIPNPPNNNALIEQKNIQLIGWDKGRVLHRVVDLKGHIIQERYLELDDMDDVVGVRLSFKENSTLIGFKENMLFIFTIDSDGSVIKRKLIELEESAGIFYSIITVKLINSESFLTNFVGEKFNGWALISNDSIVECYMSNEGEPYYKDIISNTVIELPELDENKLIVSGLNVNKGNTYQVAIYNKHEERELFILSRNF
ncbi:hypothetical protein [Neobacillus sp. YIM B06451]|uniref:hypothetical protein n=1 Tax=Neobacillus sp. YIM B06451 TaxID=3070994 RepID=UPI002931370E|nr:hypothetical protein [Neobacillus sp. YIM B06451]